MMSLLRQKLPDVLKAVAPLIIAICVLQLTSVRVPAEVFAQFMLGSALAVVGMVLLFAGVELGILPMGRFIGAELPRRGSLAVIMVVTLAVGFATTVAEPDVQVLANQIEVGSEGEISQYVVLYATATGVAVFAAAAMGRIVLGSPLTYLLTATYGLAIALALLAPSGLVPLAFDAGSVTTGVLSAPMMIALALGLSSVLAGRSAASDGFGVLGVASVGPIIVVLLIGLLS